MAKQIGTKTDSESANDSSAASHRLRKDRNKLACKKSREKRKRKAQELEETIKALEQEVTSLAAQLEAKKGTKRERVITSVFADVNVPASKKLKLMKSTVLYEPMPSLLTQEAVVQELVQAINDVDVAKFCSLFHHNSILINDFGASNMISTTAPQLFQVFQDCANAVYKFRVSARPEEKIGSGTMKYTIKCSWADQLGFSVPIQITFNLEGRIVMLNMIQLRKKLVSAVLRPPRVPTEINTLASLLFKRELH